MSTSANAPAPPTVSRVAAAAASTAIAAAATATATSATVAAASTVPPSASSVSTLDGASAKLRKNFRYSLSVFCLLLSVIGPLTYYVVLLPMWLVAAEPLAVFVGLNLGHRLGGDKGAGIGLAITGSLIAIVSAVYGGGIFAMQPTALYLFPIFVSILSGPLIALLTTAFIVIMIPVLYFLLYHTDVLLVEPTFSFEKWGVVSAVMLMLFHTIGAWLYVHLPIVAGVDVVDVVVMVLLLLEAVMG